MVAITLQVCFSNDEQLYVCKILFQGTQKSRNHRRWLSASTEWRYYWWGNLHRIGCTLAFFLLSDSHFGSGPIRDMKRTAGELKGIGVVWLWKVPLVKQVFTSYWLHQTDRRRRRKGEEGRPLDRWSWPTDRQTDMSCWPILLLPAEEEREMRARELVLRWQVSVLLHSVSSISQASEAVIGAVRHTEKDRTHTQTHT